MLRTVLALVSLSLAGCGSHAGTVLSKAECASECRRLGGGAFCDRVCDASCAERCDDYVKRSVGEPGHLCSEICGSTCSALHDRYDFAPDVCGWLVENRPDPNITPRDLPPQAAAPR